MSWVRVPSATPTSILATLKQAMSLRGYFFCVQFPTCTHTEICQKGMGSEGKSRSKACISPESYCWSVVRTTASGRTTDTRQLSGRSCGPGGIRTLVRTVRPYAFYTLIPAFGFRVLARPGPPTNTLSSKSFIFGPRPPEDYFRRNCTATPRSFGKRALERCLVPSPGDGIKPVIYYASIRQRERNCFRQLICRSLSFRSKPTRLRVLTYHLSRRQIQSSP